jgi:hypothetical protein
MEINNQWQEAFRTDLLNNLSRISNGFEKQLYLGDLMEECIWYSCDICLEYYNQGAFKGFLPGTIDNISYNVCMAMSGLVRTFGDSQRETVMTKVRELLRDSSTYGMLQQQINRYYGR